MKAKTINERGKFKSLISPALYESDDICDILLGDMSDKSPEYKLKEFKKHVKSHLFVDGVIKETGSYIFYDVKIPRAYSTIKTCEVILYAIVHKDILDDSYSRENYYGNRADILSDMIAKCILSEKNVKKFGIGNLTLDGLDIYNYSDFYGSILTFSVPNFR